MYDLHFESFYYHFRSQVDLKNPGQIDGNGNLLLDVFGFEASGFAEAEMGAGDPNLNNTGTGFGSEG